MDHAFRYTHHHNVGSREPIRLGVVETFCNISRRRTTPDDVISSASQRPRRETTQRLEGVTPRLPRQCWRQLDRPIALGSSRPKDSLQGGSSRIFSGTRLRRSHLRARRLRRFVDRHHRSVSTSQSPSRRCPTDETHPDVLTWSRTNARAGRHPRSGLRFRPPRWAQRPTTASIQWVVQSRRMQRQNVQT